LLLLWLLLFVPLLLLLLLVTVDKRQSSAPYLALLCNFLLVHVLAAKQQQRLQLQFQLRLSL